MRRNYIDYIESFLDFPKSGVVFWDFTPLHESPEVFADAIEDFSDSFKNKKITKIVAIEAKGFIIGGALAQKMYLPLVLIRKPGLTPGEVHSEKFEKEYGFGEYQIKKGKIETNDRVLIVYDILAAPGAVVATRRLVERSGGVAIGAAVVIELEYLNARETLNDLEIFSLVKIKQKKLK
ncbi:MAG: adenine phosphoribosyltransferase [bacterium]|nr:adenine phosphoribosyltransferase [bacterium]